MKKAAVIGHFDWKQNHMIGAVVKARNIRQELIHQFGSAQIVDVDIFAWRQRKMSVMLQLLLVILTSRNLVLVISDTSPALMRFFRLAKRLLHRRILYCVVGGDMAERLASNPSGIRDVKWIDALFVETSDCLEQMHQIGLTQTYLMKNFKCIEPLQAQDLRPKDQQPYSFCTFSRVIEQKGITDAIKAIQSINEERGACVCRLDIYGPVDESYREAFEELLQSNPSARYCGSVDAGASVATLKAYDGMLFPTKYQTEGIPGTIIDAFAAGLPIICSDWVRCRQIITPGETGIVYAFGSLEGLRQSIEYAVSHSDEMYRMRLNCLKAFGPYQSELAIQPLLNEML